MFDGSKKGNLIRVSNRLVYNHPSHIQVCCLAIHALSLQACAGKAISLSNLRKEQVMKILHPTEHPACLVGADLGREVIQMPALKGLHTTVLL